MLGMKDSRKIAQLEVWATQMGFWRADVPAMQTCQAELAHSASQLQFVKTNATTVYVLEGLNAIADLHASALQALAQDRDFSARVFAQDAMRMAVDNVYVGRDPSGDRLTSALRHHLDTQLNRSAAWQAAEPENQVVSEHIASIKAECRASPWYAEAPDWPSLAARTDAADFGDLLHSIWAVSADAQDTATEDMRIFVALS